MFLRCNIPGLSPVSNGFPYVILAHGLLKYVCKYTHKTRVTASS